MRREYGLFLLGVVAIFMLSGCTSIQLLDSESPEYQRVISYVPVEDKAVLYLYRTKISYFQGMVTTVDIGPVELSVFPNSLHRFELAPGTYNMEPNGIGTFAIEDELDITLEAGKVYFVELRHTSRFAIPNVSALFERSVDEVERIMASESLNVVPIEVL